jgi:enoyl-CoA hydratase
MSYTNLTITVEKGIGWIEINRPDKLNALNSQTIEEMRDAFFEFQNNDEVKVVILTGTGEKAFIAGADISELAGFDYFTGKDYVDKGQSLTKLMENYPKPVIAAINGFALGGGTEMALACHFRIASENTKMGQPEVKLGLIPGFGGTQRLSRLVGKGMALEMILSGRVVDAQEAFRIGLVNRVVPLAELRSTVEALAQEIIGNGPFAVETAISAVNEGLDMTLDEGLELEAELFGRVCSTEDSKEGTKAFLEKRKADFIGK